VCVCVRMSVCVYECVCRLKTMSFWDEVMEEMRMEFKALQESFIATSLDKEGTLTQKSHECRHHSRYHLNLFALYPPYHLELSVICVSLCCSSDFLSTLTHKLTD